MNTAFNRVVQSLLTRLDLCHFPKVTQKGSKKSKKSGPKKALFPGKQKGSRYAPLTQRKTSTGQTKAGKKGAKGKLQNLPPSAPKSYKAFTRVNTLTLDSEG